MTRISFLSQFLCRPAFMGKDPQSFRAMKQIKQNLGSPHTCKSCTFGPYLLLIWTEKIVYAKMDVLIINLLANAYKFII